MDKIVSIQLGRLEKLLADRKIALDLDGEAIDWLAGKGYDPAYGARPLKRVLQKELQDPLARLRTHLGAAWNWSREEEEALQHECSRAVEEAAAAWLATMLPALGRLSTSTGCPRLLAICSATARAVRSAAV